MSKRKELPAGWAYQAYRFEVDKPGKYHAMSSHKGAKRFAWNYMLGVIEEQHRVKEAFRVLALRQGARQDEAEAWAKEACWSSYLRDLNEKRKKDHEAKVAPGQRGPGKYRPVSEWCLGRRRPCATSGTGRKTKSRLGGPRTPRSATHLPSRPSPGRSRTTSPPWTAQGRGLTSASPSTSAAQAASRSASPQGRSPSPTGTTCSCPS